MSLSFAQYLEVTPKCDDLSANGGLERNSIIPDIIVLISIKFVHHYLTNIFKSGIVMYSYIYNITQRVLAMTAARSHDIVVTTVGEQLSTLPGSDSKDLAKPEHYINIQCSGFYFGSRF